jgi:type IV secretory pathway TrbD component
MKKNVGTADRTVRILVGLGLVAAGFYFQSWWGAIGVIPLFTGSTGWCPGYLPFGISTCKTAP